MATETSDPATTPMTDAEREEAASQLVDRFSLWSGAAGLIPMPLIDVVAVGGVQLQMLRKLSEIYGVPFTDNRGKSVIASLAGAIIPASTATTTAMTFGSVIKGIPGIGSAVGALTMPVYSAGATYVIGQVFMKHFASGGTLLDFNPPDYREFIKTQQAKFEAQAARRPAGSAIRFGRRDDWRPGSGSGSGDPDRYEHALAACCGAAAESGSTVSRETLRHGVTARHSGRLHRVLPARRALRQPAPHGIHRHVPSVACHHAGDRAAHAADYRTVPPR